MSPGVLLSMLYCGAAFGGSFLFMRVAAPDLPAPAVAFLRVGIAATVLLIVGGPRLLGDLRRHWRGFVFLGVFMTGAPFLLFAAAEQSITAGLPGTFTFLDKEETRVGGLPAWRVEYRYTAPGIDVTGYSVLVRGHRHGWVVTFLPIVMVFAFGALLPRLSVAAAQLFFYVYAAAMGLSLSFLFAVYTGASIGTTFLSTSAAFAGLSLYGYTTKRNLSGMGSFLMMGVVGILVAMVANIFIGSSALQFAISVIGVLIFAGLTVYDTQAIKGEYVENARAGNEEWMGKAAIMGALRLYLDFINMFTFLLQFMGDRR